ncbi:MAG: glycosyltransferase family 87 protein [Anaerolineae bacterium]
MIHLRNHPAYPYLLRILLIGVVLLLVLLIMNVWHMIGYNSPGTTDLVAYWTAGQLLLAGQSPYDFDRLYQLQLELGSQDMVPTSVWNPPWLLLWIFPLLLLAFPLAAMVWLVLNFGLIIACGTFIWRTLAGPSAARQIGIAWIATVTFLPALFTLGMGQISTIVLLGVVGFLYFASRDRDFLAGLCLALTTIKPHVVYLLWITVAWWIIAGRRWKTAAGVAGLLLPSVGLLLLRWPASVSGYLTVLQHPPVSYAAPTVGIVLRLLVFGGADGTQFLPSLAAGLAVLGYLLIRRPTLNWKTAISPLLLLSVATAAYGWSFDFIVLLVPYIQIVIWFIEEHGVPIRHKATAVSGLLLITAVMAVQKWLMINDVFFFWMPWALGVVYLYARPAKPGYASWVSCAEEPALSHALSPIEGLPKG